MLTTKSRLTWCCKVTLLVVACNAAILFGADEDTLPFDVDQWLNGPDRQDFPWQVSVSLPTLNFQQRHVVTISATIQGGSFPSSTIGRDLHFVLKVATAGNRWISDFSYTCVPVPPRFDYLLVIKFTDHVYLRPGSYTVALLVYDPLLDKGNIWRKDLEVRPQKKDPLPELDRDLPEVEFLVFDQGMPLPLAKGKEWLPVRNSRSLCIDIVANTSVDWDYNPKLGVVSRGFTYAPVHRYKAHVNSMEILRASSVLSHLKLQKGKVRVSILDTLRMTTLFDREDAADFDWQRASEVMAKQNPDTIANDLLGSQTEASGYLFGKLSAIMEDDGCASEGERPLKIVIIVSSQLRFPKDTIIQKVPRQDPASIQLIYFPLSDYMKDDLLKMLKPAKPQVYLRGSRPFRRMLADLISYLEKQK